jgi:hypothetical protein
MKLRRNLAWLGALSGLTSAALLLLPAAQGESKGENKAVIIGTASVRGEVSPCG